MDSGEEREGLSRMSRVTRLSDAKGRRAEKGPIAGSKRLGSTGIVKMSAMNSRKEEARRGGNARGAVSREANDVRRGDALAGRG